MKIERLHILIKICNHCTLERNENFLKAKVCSIDEYHYPNHEAVDGYHHYKEDIALFAEMGFKQFRMSISWSRLYPTGLEKEPTKKVLNSIVICSKEMQKYGIEPLVIIYILIHHCILKNIAVELTNREIIEHLC